MKNISTISDHSLNLDLISKNGWVLDLGCLNFNFYKELKKITKNIICVDPNPKIGDIPDDCIFINKAIHTINNQKIDYFIYEDQYGNSLLKNENDYCPLITKIEVETISIGDIMERFNIKQFDLIKFDIEGAEYDILLNIDYTISKQYSIEFHDFRNFLNSKNFHEKFIEKCSRYCDIVKHEKSKHPWEPVGKCFNYWDSLFILKNEFYKI